MNMPSSHMLLALGALGPVLTLLDVVGIPRDGFLYGTGMLAVVELHRWPLRTTYKQLSR